MMWLKPKAVLFPVIFASMASGAYANVVWPALYVVDSHFRFWYGALIGLFLEAGVLRFGLIPDIKKALFVSFIGNILSGTAGIYILVFGMVGWHLVVDIFVPGSFALFNKMATIGLMLIGSVLLEKLAVRGIWKYPIWKTRPLLILGNMLSYGVIVADLFVFGG
jgi:hypothetical protein